MHILQFQHSRLPFDPGDLHHIRIFRKIHLVGNSDFIIWITGLFKETRLEDSSGQEQEIRPTICMLSFRGLKKKMSLEDWILLCFLRLCWHHKILLSQNSCSDNISLSLEPSVWCMVLFTKHVCAVKRDQSLVTGSECTKSNPSSYCRNTTFN